MKLEKIHKQKKQELLAEDLEFPEFIRLLRHALGLKLSAVSDFCGFSRHKLYRMETGKIIEDPNDGRIESLAQLYGIPLPLMREKFYTFVAKQGQRDVNADVVSQGDRRSGGRHSPSVPVSREKPGPA